MKLKTLKDFNWEENVTIFDGDMTGVNEDSIKKELKAEAVKWVKNLKLMELREDTSESHSNRDCAYWIKHFFNITEEDLK